MPEGDTIFRAARTLHRALAGKTVTRFDAIDPRLSRVDVDRPIAGRTIDEVRSIGKHLLISFSGGLVLRTHMRMNGRWDIYRPGERWWRPRREMRLLLETADFVAVGFNVPEAEWLDEKALARHEVATLGPDLLREPFDRDEALRRLQAQRRREVGEALLDQHVMAGIGNVYKSEIAFLCGVSPFTDVGALTSATLEALVDTARRLLQANAGADSPSAIVTYTGMRRTTGRADPSARLWVYGREGAPCRRCTTPIRFARQGPHARVTYHCPRCQARPAQPEAAQ